MKSSLCILVLAATLQIAVFQETEVECPNPVPLECADSNVCENSDCPRYLSTKCCVELVDGECIAQIRRLPNLNVVTDKCTRGIESCLTKVCPERRTCMEEVIGCPEGNPDCGIHRVRAKCILTEVPRAPSTCDEIVCADGTTCVVSESGRGTKVDCMIIEPESCDDLECDDGMQCVERVKPRCIPIRSPGPRPSNCSQLECPEGLVCMLLDRNRGARCAKPPIPTSCMELECDPGLVCEKVGITERVRCVLAELPQPRTLPPLPPSGEPGSTGERPTRLPLPPVIRIARHCDEIDCEDGYECKLIIDREINLNRQPVATCMPRECPLRRRARPPSRCEEIKCESDEMCVLCGEGRDTRARCMRRDPRDEDMEDRINMTTPMSGRDRDRDRDLEDDRDRDRDRDLELEDDRDMMMMMRRPPMLCSELVCGPEDIEKCQELKLGDGRPQRALCIPLDAPESCEEADCDAKENQTCIELENDEVKVAHCVPDGMRPARPEVTRAPPTGSPRPTRPEGTRIPPTGGPRPTRPTMPERPRPAQRCEELDCGRGFECLHVRRDERRRAMCVRMRRNEMCRPAPTRPDDDRERPTGRPDRPTGRPDRPTGRPDRPTGRPDRPTGRPDRPTGRPDRPTGMPDRPTGRPTGRPDRPTDRPDRERPTGEPDKEKPTGLPEGERPTGKPEDRESTLDMDKKKPTDSPMEGDNVGRDKEKRSAKSLPRNRDGKGDSQSDKSMSDSDSTPDDSTASDGLDKSKSRSAGRDRSRGKSRDLDSSGDSEEGSGDGTSTKSRRKNGRDKDVDPTQDVIVELNENGNPKEMHVPEDEKDPEIELDENGNPKKKPEDEERTEDSEIELNENGNPKKKPEDEERTEDSEIELDPKKKPEDEERTEDSEIELDENGNPKKKSEDEGPTQIELDKSDEMGSGEEKSDEMDSGEEEEPTGKPIDRNRDVNGRDEMKKRDRRQASDRTPLIDILTAVHPPDLCMERRCCEGESCFVRRMAENLPPLAFCAPDDFEGQRPPIPRPPTCEELMCEEGFECVLSRDDDRRPDDDNNALEERERDGRREDVRDNRNDRDRNMMRGRAVCVRRRPDRPDRPDGPTEPTTRRPRPTRDPNRPRPTTNGDRPRPTRGPRPTGGPDRPRPTTDGDRLRPTRGPRPTGGPNRPRPTTDDGDRLRPTRGPRPTGGPDRPRPTRDPMRPSDRPMIPAELPE